MAARQHLTAPDPRETRFPKGIPYIVGNELAERFSFYGMKCILVIFMTTYLLGPDGESANMGRDEAVARYHDFTSLAYFFPLIGALVADIWLGKYRTILYLSLLYCVGHGSLALMDVAPEHFGFGMRPFLFAGLVLIAMGAGAIKPCVSAHVGDQFGLGNKHMLTKVFNWFYFSINIGAMTSMILTPILLESHGPWLAFGLPGVLMGVATFLFWLGRHEFVHVPAAGWTQFKAEVLGPDGRRALKNLAPLFLLFVPVFWALYDQTGSSWVLQTEQMDRFLFTSEAWLPSQLQSINSMMILIGIPLFTYFFYPMCDKVWKLSPLRKIGIGFVLTAGAFAVSAMIETWIVAGSEPVIAGLWAAAPAGVTEGMSMPTKLTDMLQLLKAEGWTSGQMAPYLVEMPNIAWQVLAYLLITAGEIMVSIVCLEFAYTQSPKRMKSFIMGIYFVGVSLGNQFVSLVNRYMESTRNSAGNSPLDGPNYFWFFVGLLLVTTVIYVVYSQFYKGQTFIQGDDLSAVQAEASAEGTDAR
ncbi:MAG: POT family MFS transporter [Planctomycetota bacterium]|nr:POT family MFS transporter [Planctomycetota bacterium]